MEEIFETLRKQIKGDFDQNYWTTLTKEYIRFFNEPKKQYELTIKNYLQWKKI